MRDTDVSIEHAETKFRDITLSHPLTLSGGAITEISLAIVSVSVRNRSGARATGRGASVLSVPWSWPTSRLPSRQRDAVLRELTRQLAHACVGNEPADPIASWSRLVAALDSLRGSLSARMAHDEAIPHLAGMLALGAVDNAIHDAWARAAGRSAYTMYDRTYLGTDLSDLLGADFAGRYPGDALRPPRVDLPVQHVISPSDPLRPDASHPGARPLSEWLEHDNPRHLKIKAGHDPAHDADRVVAIYELARQYSADEPRLSIDPNEAYASPAQVIELLDEIGRRHPPAAAAIAYIEQPIPRGCRVEPTAMRQLGHRVPVLIDEGLADVDGLRAVTRSGWSGLVIKASKGQTFALLAHSYAHANGLYTTMQDLTATDLALCHSARLASVLACTSPHFECNSRQYAPHANERLHATQPRLTTVVDGQVSVGPTMPGIY